MTDNSRFEELRKHIILLNHYTESSADDHPLLLMLSNVYKMCGSKRLDDDQLTNYILLVNRAARKQHQTGEVIIRGTFHSRGNYSENTLEVNVQVEDDNQITVAYNPLKNTSVSVNEAVTVNITLQPQSMKGIQPVVEIDLKVLEFNLTNTL